MHVNGDLCLRWGKEDGLVSKGRLAANAPKCQRGRGRRCPVRSMPGRPKPRAAHSRRPRHGIYRRTAGLGWFVECRQRRRANGVVAELRGDRPPMHISADLVPLDRFCNVLGPTSRNQSVIRRRGRPHRLERPVPALIPTVSIARPSRSCTSVAQKPLAEMRPLIERKRPVQRRVNPRDPQST